MPATGFSAAHDCLLLQPVSAQGIGSGRIFQTGGDAHESVRAFNVVRVGREPATGQSRFGELRCDAFKGLEGSTRRDDFACADQTDCIEHVRHDAVGRFTQRGLSRA